MSIPNPPNASRRHIYNTWTMKRIWREFMVGCLNRQTPQLAAKQADEACAEYLSRFPLQQPDPDDEPTATAPESDKEFDEGPAQTKKVLQ